MRGKVPYDSGKRGSSIGSRKRAGLSGETADFLSSFTTSFLSFPSAFLSSLSLEAIKSNPTNTATPNLSIYPSIHPSIVLIHPSIYTSIRLRDAIGLLYLTEKSLTYLTYPPPSTMKEKGFRLAQSNGQKNGFATGISHWKRKASSTEQTLAFPSRAKSFEQRRLHRCCLLCALHAGACFRLGATTTTIWRFSSAADPQTIYFFFIPPLPLSIVKKESFRLSLLPLWVATPFVSAFHFASLSFPPRKSSSLAPSFDGARWC